MKRVESVVYRVCSRSLDRSLAFAERRLGLDNTFEAFK